MHGQQAQILTYPSECSLASNGRGTSSLIDRPIIVAYFLPTCPEDSIFKTKRPRKQEVNDQNPDWGTMNTSLIKTTHGMSPGRDI
jgi:hypothetical protein